MSPRFLLRLQSSQHELLTTAQNIYILPEHLLTPNSSVKNWRGSIGFQYFLTWNKLLNHWRGSVWSCGVVGLRCVRRADDGEEVRQHELAHVLSRLAHVLVCVLPLHAPRRSYFWPLVKPLQCNCGWLMRLRQTSWSRIMWHARHCTRTL